MKKILLNSAVALLPLGAYAVSASSTYSNNVGRAPWHKSAAAFVTDNPTDIQKFGHQIIDSSIASSSSALSSLTASQYIL